MCGLRLGSVTFSVTFIFSVVGKKRKSPSPLPSETDRRGGRDNTRQIVSKKVLPVALHWTIISITYRLATDTASVRLGVMVIMVWGRTGTGRRFQCSPNVSCFRGKGLPIWSYRKKVIFSLLFLYTRKRQSQTLTWKLDEEVRWSLLCQSSPSLVPGKKQGDVWEKI